MRRPAPRTCLIAAVVLMAASLVGPARAQTETDSAAQPAAWRGDGWLTRLLDRFVFLPEYHLTGDVYFLALYKNADYRRRYFVENNADMELFLAGYRRSLYASLGLYVRTTMGRQDGAIMFDPRELRYCIDPAVELRLGRLDLRGGLDHSCFHEIDSWDGRTKYWNKAYLALMSKNARPIEYRRRIIIDGRWDFGSRFSYEAKLGHYLKRAFGLLDPAVIGGNHDYSWEMTGTNRYALFRSLDWAVNARSVADLNLSRQGKLRQCYQVGLEGHLRRGDAGMMIFANYNLLDQLIVRPKDRLLEVGVRFYN